MVVARATAAYNPASRPQPTYRKPYNDDNVSTISERTDRNVVCLFYLWNYLNQSMLIAAIHGRTGAYLPKDT